METQAVLSKVAKPNLTRRFGLLSATALNMTNMIGVGPFITIPALMTALNGPQAMLGWVVALIIAICDGMVWSELGAAFPGSGGSYLFLREGFRRETFGRPMAFLFIWQFILSGPLEIASGYIGFSQYLQYLWPGMTPTVSKLLIVALGIFTIGLLYRRIDSIEKITITLWIGTMLTIGAVLVTGAFHFNPKIAFDFAPGSFQFSFGFLIGLGAASRVGVYDYLGYYNICYIGEEVREPGRVIPRSIIMSVILVAFIYVGINLSIIGVVPWRQFVPATDPPAPVASMMMQNIYGTKVAAVFTVLVLWTALGSVFALLLGYSRIPFAAAREGYFFKVFARLHPKKNFPHVSLVVMGLIAIVCSFLPLMQVIDTLLATRILVQFVGQIVALILLRKNAPNLKRPYRMWLYPIPALLALVGWFFIFGTTDIKTLLYSGAALLLGVAGFLCWSRYTAKWPFQTA
ncbi:MAG: amino acid permease-associated region [Verrucomicrobiales bacterium]|nr:amino acid permease-associated region [Verrucomicrobiales bacterium]